MESTKKISVEIAGKHVEFESGHVANQANGAVTIRLEDTILFSAATASKRPTEGKDYFPLQVEYREKFYAAGRFPGGYFKREARPTEKETLTARATDRPIRPLFPAGYRNEVQVINHVFCVDGENDPDILSINAASASLTISDIPFMGPIGAVRVGRADGKFVINPTHTDLVKSDLDLVYVGTREMPLMIEGDGKEVSEKDILAAMREAHPHVVKLIDAQLELRRSLGLPEKQIGEWPAVDASLLQKAREIAGAQLADALKTPGKADRHAKMDAMREALKAKLLESAPTMTDGAFAQVFDALETENLRRNLLDHGVRVDGRGFDEVRPLSAQVALLPRTHGSALFNRGETQALAIITLGTISDAQSMDAVAGGPDEKRFMLHYNFPPFSVGEVGRIGFTSRREVGHGALAERSLLHAMPADYPYTVRIVSEILGSNGSSSMASVCAGSLALMDAGVTVAKAVAGISIGLFTAPGKAQLVTDIVGAEDHCGDMDFKVAGTRQGITGFQVDLKIPGLSWELTEQAFEKARVARMKILDFMDSVIAQPRPDLSKYAPRIHRMMIAPDKIGALIGPGGKNIRRITDTLNVQIDVEDDGTVSIFSSDKAALDAAIREVELITGEAEVDKIYRGKVTGIKEFGAFVEILPGKDGLVHISELADFRVKRVEDICKIGDMMWVKCIGVDDRGKIKLSRRAALKEKDAAGDQPPADAPR